MGRAAGGYGTTTAGSAGPEATELATLDGRARERTREADELIGRSESAVREIIDRLVGHAPQLGVADGTVRRDRTREGGQPAHRRHADVVGRELRRIGRTGYGAETTGAWINDDGTVEQISSGRDTPWYRRTRAVLAGLGRKNTALDTHCEAQAVVRMHQEGKRHGTIVLSRPPCGVGETPGRPYTCDKRLGEIIRRLLPAGSTLTIVDPDHEVWIYPKEVEE